MYLVTCSAHDHREKILLNQKAVSEEEKDLSTFISSGNLGHQHTHTSVRNQPIVHLCSTFSSSHHTQQSCDRKQTKGEAKHPKKTSSSIHLRTVLTCSGGFFRGWFCCVSFRVFVQNSLFLCLIRMKENSFFKSPARLKISIVSLQVLMLLFFSVERGSTEFGRRKALRGWSKMTNEEEWKKLN